LRLIPNGTLAMFAFFSCRDNALYRKILSSTLNALADSGTPAINALSIAFGVGLVAPVLLAAIDAIVAIDAYQQFNLFWPATLRSLTYHSFNRCFDCVLW
jgi:hypothetical protein